MGVVRILLDHYPTTAQVRAWASGVVFGSIITLAITLAAT